MIRYLICSCLLHVSLFTLAVDITPVNLRAEYKNNPFLDEKSPRLSWELVSKKYNQYQSAYQVIVASSLEELNRDEGDIWDTGKVISSQTNQIAYVGKELKSRQQVWWKVRVWDADDKAGKWSEANFWEMGLLADTDWKATWIGYDLNDHAKLGKYHLPPSPYLRNEAEITKKVRTARLYISSLGLHEFYINGNKIGRDYFASGWTDYDKRVYYNAYDVTSYLQNGTNVFGAVLSDGWYSGYLGYALLVGTEKVRGYYGDIPLLKAQVELTFEDGSRQVISTGADWKASTGAITESDLLQGERHDATKERLGWNNVNFNDDGWLSVQVFGEKEGRKLQLYPSQPVRVVNELPIKTIKRLDNGKYIIDFGQNFAGIIRLKIKGKPNDSLVFRYGEMLHPNGTLVTENLRTARATDTYVLKGDPRGEEWSPSFTFHGFQFVEVSGLTEMPKADFLVGLAMSSDLETAGHLETDNSVLNQIYSNIVWTQRANYLDVPTDCPQRDERLGWTADAQVYIRSATYNNDIAAFHTKWIQDLNDSQWPNGAFPVYAPMPVDGNGKAAIRASDTYSPGWSEAGIICTYEIFRAYNDTRIVEKSLPYMVKFMDFLKSKADSDGVIREGSFEEISPKGGFGDWLSVGKKTSPDLLAAMYYFHCARLMEEMCAAIGEADFALTYSELSSSIKDAIMNHYMQDGAFKIDAASYGNGEGYVEGQNGFAGHTQTSYANAIYMHLLDEPDFRLAGRFLRELVEQHDDKLTTGFLGFKPLLPALSMTGSTDKAYKLLLSTEYPSLGYEVVNGATSIWERWDSYIKGEGFVHNASMNSFSHYAFGAVNEWMFENMVGIKPIESGFRTFFIRPEIPSPDIQLKKASGAYHSIAGMIKSAWDYSGARKTHSLGIPVNTTAYFYLESPSLDRVYLNGKVITESKLVKDIKHEGNGFKIALGSGTYEIVIHE
ncbi:alpha-L-rhamnosidase [Parapedobacter pyrenivorans]|uniref:alpha-L-rhamnosidase n=1 Tax=Parapedobacter pyrenivorans TaxID=1305674 RepID=A0A917MCC3_9SPHI|nr:alpha-L-rhamnosidase [Parapedobacter pyrenivorans]GGG92257.1 alpha-L-rhamnosidase [Parapedobacter pyrenivorans]